MTDVLMPALSPTMEEGGLAKWLVKPGDTVKSGDVIAEIETDKATMEVEAVDEGVVEALLVDAGAQGVKVGTPIARLKGEGEAAAPPPAPKAEAPPPKPEPPKATPTPQPAPTPTLAPQPAPAARAESQRIFASPLARRIAQQNGVDLALVKGSGPHGRIVKRDVEGAPASPGRPAPAPAQAHAPAHVPSLEELGIPPGSYDLIPLDGMRRTIAKRMTESARDIPHFPLNIDVEIDALLAARTAINGLLEKEGVKVSVNDLVIKACAVALKRVPEANASYTPEGLALHHGADVAMAVAIEGGLITPIVRAAETKGLAQIARETKDLGERARTRKLKPEEYLGGTFSVSNLGMMGIKSFGSIINPPQGCILSVGVGEKRPVVRGDRLEIATLMSVTLTCDHRVVDGATGARWLQAFKALIEQPAAMLV
ncbi:MAG: branched-chain alpha-keto acid dehydrogenase subunit [Caulobacteraceae bacterium]|nr:branched-chain alpha-keto acid dehydrogenase subunit [Caulobacteraceae bacterium]